MVTAVVVSRVGLLRSPWLFVAVRTCNYLGMLSFVKLAALHLKQSQEVLAGELCRSVIRDEAVDAILGAGKAPASTTEAR